MTRFPPPTVFLETNVLKASADTILVLLPEKQQARWGDHVVEINLHRPVFENQNVKHLASKRRNIERYQDSVALRYIAALAKAGKITLLSHPEVLFELWGLKRTQGDGPRFYGAPIRMVDPPIPHRSVLFDGSGSDYAYEYMARLEHPRFKELQRACGAYQGPGKQLNRSQLKDAFHLFCAEAAGANYFLTHDDKLMKSVGSYGANRVGVSLITPKRLLTDLLVRCPAWILPVLKERWRIYRSGRNLAERFQDASDEFWGQGFKGH